MKAIEAGIRMLRYHDHTRTEVERRLAEKGFSLAEIESAVNQLMELKYIDDARFAENWVRKRLATKPMGERRLVYELKGKGVSEEIIQEIVRKELDSCSEIELARRTLKEKSVRNNPWEKIARTLWRRGFSQDTISVMREECKQDKE